MHITRSWAVYNEIEEYAADWLENLIAAGLIAPGIVDRRSIVDIRPDDYRGFRQAHFFAGIGVWSYALRRAGVSDDTALWTGSCPCQPFSAAGAGGGVDDERHLWPHWFHLIGAARPPRVYGEQVASKDGLGWLDLVSSDLEGAGYSIWAVDTCSAGSGAPHIRQRLRFCADDLGFAAGGVADGSGTGAGRHTGTLLGAEGALAGRCSDSSQPLRSTGGLADLNGSGQPWECGSRTPEVVGVAERVSVGILGDDERQRLEKRFGDRVFSGQQTGTFQGETFVGASVHISRLADTKRFGRIGREGSERGCQHVGTDARRIKSDDGPFGIGEIGDGSHRPGPTNGHWADADWLFCRDGKWRPVEPGTFPLANGSAFKLGSGSTFEGRSRQGMLKGYGNAIDAEATVDFIEATLEPDVVDLQPLRTDAADLFADLIG